ncbi:MAG TPA: phosphate acyltransferase [Thermohalobaculum sp.]|nr:phosphate acyltransferase [Thermohalobaculum sp.]
MQILTHCREAARANFRRVVMPEGADPRIRAAAERLAGEGLALPVLIGAEVQGCETVDPASDPRAGELAALVAARRERMSARMAARLLAKPLYFGAALVAGGHAAAMVAGAANPTRRVIEAGMMTVGPAEGVATPSSFFLMVLRERALVFADCALNVEPSAAELADIAVASGRSAARLLGAARVAMLSYSTAGSGAGASVDKVREAVALAKAAAPELAPGIEIDGEFQADTALNAAIAAKKGAGGGVAGQANVLVFPDLNSGNIAYKLVQELAGAQAVGPFLQGFARPVCDLSRGATVEDIVAAAVVTLALG